MSEVDDVTEFGPAADPLRAAFEALAAAADPVAKVAALKRAATDLATPIRHGMLDRYEIEERLIDLADSHGLIEATTRGTVEGIVVKGLTTPALPAELKHANGHDNGDAPPPLSIDEWLARDLPEPDFLMGDWLTTTTRALLVAPTGLGKTNFALALAMHAAACIDFLHWRARRTCRGLYVDGEMSRRLLKQRIGEAAARLGSRPIGFHVLSHEDVEGFAPLNTPAGQACIERQIERIGGVDFIVLDSIMCLTVGDMKEGVPWAQVMPWVRSLTKRNIGQIWVHHTGHDETRSYGDKTREWQMDCVVHLEAVKRDETDVSFSLEFRKARERTPATRADFQTARIALISDAWTSEASATARKGHVSPLGLKFLSALYNALADAGELRNNGRRCVTLDIWRGECARMGLVDPTKADSARTLFNKHRRELIAENHVVCDNELAWLAR